MDQNKYKKLKQIVEKEPLWYQNSEIKYLVSLFRKKHLTKEEISHKYLYKKLFKESDFITGEKGYNWDQWRLPIECVVIHHTSSSPTISLDELNALGLRLYIEQYNKDKDVTNQPIHSNHYWHGKPKTKNNMSFVSYHYLIRPNGKVTQMVDGSACLWHAGNWDVNRKSIGIAIAGKFNDREPNKEVLISLADIVRKYKISKEKVYGHCEVINKELLSDTICPGNLFLDSWKNKLVKII